MNLSVIIIMCFLRIAAGFINLADIECGITAAAGRQARIVGGTSSDEGEVPWAASVWRQGVHQCGATVLAARWLLTAGHCVCSDTRDFFISKQLSIVVGFRDLTEKKEKQPVSSIVPHPSFQCGFVENDVALLQTTRHLQWTQELRPACLPQPLAPNYSGALALVAGWGWTHEDRSKGIRPSVLQKAEVFIVGNEDCNSWFKSQGKKFRVNETQLCAGHEVGGVDACWTDSGGPLTIRNDGRTILAGVVSTGSGCARPKLPGIYTRVSKYTSWIVNSVQDNARSGFKWYKKFQFK